MFKEVWASLKTHGSRARQATCLETGGTGLAWERHVHQ